MHCQVLSSGSAGNATLVRAGELTVLVDAGLPPREMTARFDAAGLPHRSIDHVLVTHGHLDHARSAGVVAKRHDATVHCPNNLIRARSVRRAPRFHSLKIGSTTRIEARSEDRFTYEAIPLRHDCDPTVGYRIEHGDRVLGIATDLGRVDEPISRGLAGTHVLVLEFNYDPDMLAEGPYPEALKRRIGGDRGHLSNDQAAALLAKIAGPQLHTLVLGHLSLVNNTPERALEAARATLERLDLVQVTVLVASQDVIGENLKV